MMTSVMIHCLYQVIFSKFFRKPTLKLVLVGSVLNKSEMEDN